MKPGVSPDQFGKVQNESPLIETRGGMHVPAKGTLKALVVYMQTKDDPVADEKWPKDQMPIWSQTLPAELRRYFWSMSNEMLDLQFDVYPQLLITGSTENDYINWGTSHGEMMKDVVRRLDSELDFADYDHWVSQDRVFRVIEGSDKKVDLVFFFHRSVASKAWMPFTGVSDLNFKGLQFIDGYQRYFYGGTGYNNDAGSTGLIVAGYPGSGVALYYEAAYGITIHELMHKLYGDTHLTDVFAGLGVNSANASGLGMAAYERHVLGYMDIQHLPKQKDTTVTIRDYMTTDEAIAIQVAGVPRYFYVIEFRALKSEFDTAPEKGVFIYRLDDNVAALQKTILPMSAEGNWQWKRDSATGFIDHDYPDPLTGYSRIRKIVIDGKPYWIDGYRGHIGIAFIPQRQPFGVFRNPTPDFIYGTDTIRTNMTISVVAMNDSAATISITYTPPVVLSVEQSKTAGFTLGQSYPNPVSSASQSEVNIPFSIERNEPVAFALFDYIGRPVYHLDSVTMEPGNHTISVSTEGLLPGVYFYEVAVSGAVQRRPLIISR